MTEGTDAIEVDSAATRAGVIAVALVDLPRGSEAAVLEDLRLEWADRRQASAGADLVDLRGALVAVVSGDLLVVSAAVTAKAGSAQ